MSNYAKINPRIWNDQKFRSMSTEGKLVFFLLVTLHDLPLIYAFKTASEMGWCVAAFKEAIDVYLDWEA